MKKLIGSAQWAEARVRRQFATICGERVREVLDGIRAHMNSNIESDARTEPGVEQGTAAE
jgi:hypothetical protein